MRATEIERLAEALRERYTVERELGRGGMASVYLAQDRDRGHAVALKVLLEELVSAVGSQRFLREIDIAARLAHPYVLPLLDSGAVNGVLYYSMPVVEAGSLRARIKRERQLPIDDTLRYAEQVADALAFAHSCGVAHRDVKPSNIMLEGGTARVSDFGIAMMLEGVPAEKLTVSGITPGSPEYMSPEQALGDELVDARTDIYSLGCVMFEMLTGDPPFTASMPQAILAKKLTEPLPDLRVVRESVPEHAARAIEIALAKSPADRFQSADDFARALKGDFGDRIYVRSAASARAAPLPTQSGARLAGLVAAAVAGGLALLTSIGFLTTRVYDMKLQVPLELTPSRSDFLVVGGKTLLPALAYCFFAVALYPFARLMWRAASFGLHRIPTVGSTMDAVHDRTTYAWRRLWSVADVATRADAYFVTSVVVAIAVMLPFRSLLAASWTADIEPLACTAEDLQRSYGIVMPLLTAGLGLGWYRFYRMQRATPGTGTRVSLAKWGGLSWVVLVAVIMTLPWRLLWDNSYPRALYGGEPAYVVMETETEVVVYRPSLGSTERVRITAEAQPVRLGSSGYVFEGVELFESGGRSCR